MKPRGKSAAAKKKAAAYKTASPKSKGKASPKAKAKSRASPKSSPKASPKAKSGRKSKASPTAKAKAKTSPKKRTRQVTRKAPIADDGTVLALGCSNCRFAENGSTACERADFKGRRRTDVSQAVIDKAQQSLSKNKRLPKNVVV